MLFDEVDPVGIVFIRIAVVWLVASVIYGRDDADEDRRNIRCAHG